MNKNDRAAGLDLPISRRDFIGGVGIALSGTLVACPWAESEVPDLSRRRQSPLSEPVAPYPPTQTGLRGNHAGSFEVAHRLRDGQKSPDSDPVDTREVYDLVVVGAGISGLSAAWFFKQKKPDARILLLDNHDDFGGHAKRNEFWLNGRMYLSHGGTINISDFNEYDEPAQRLIRELGIDIDSYTEFVEDQLYSSRGSSRAVFFDRETFGQDRLVTNEGKPSWREFFARSPLAPAVQKELTTLFESDADYLASLSLEEKKRYLRSVSYQEFLLDRVGIQPEAIRFLNDAGYWAIGIDALSAWAATYSGYPGTEGLGFTGEEEDRRYFQFPDGNASIARLLVRSLIPGVAPGNSMEDSLTAPFAYDRVDQEGASARLRLESTVVRVKHLGPAESATEVEVDYVHKGKAERVRGRSVVLACYNSMIPYLCSELPSEQKMALSQSLKAPLIYSNVLVRNSKAFEKLGTHDIRCPGCYFEDIRLNAAISMGDYSFPSSPDDPTVVRLFRIPLQPGLSAQEQWKAGRYDILSTSFETYEREIRSQLGRVLSPGGFDPARDIEAITVNRWPHGYTYGQDPETGEIAYVLDEIPLERAPWIRARQRFGRIVIANSDAAANAMTESAIGQAHRAVSELLPG